MVLAGAAAAWGLQARRERGRALEEARRQEQEGRAREAAARALLDKAGRVQEVVARWGPLLATVQRLDALQHSVLTPAEKRARADACWADFDEFRRATPADPAAQAVMLAFTGWARRLAGREEEGAAWIRQAQELDRDVPHGAIVSALVDLGRYLELRTPPAIVYGPTGLELSDPPGETAEMRALRARMEAALARAESARLWGGDLAAPVQQAVRAAGLLQAGRYEEAEAGLGAALGAAPLALFRTDLLWARAHVRWLRRRFADALADLGRVVEARPDDPSVRVLAGRAHAATGQQDGVRGADGGPEYRRAIEAFDAALERAPGDAGAHAERGLVFQALGQAERARGQDARPMFEKALADFDAALAARPGDASGWANRGITGTCLAEVDRSFARDPFPALARAIADLERGAAIDPALALAWSNLGSAHLARALAVLARGGDPAADFARARAAHERAAQTGPARGWAHKTCGLTWFHQADWEARCGRDAGASYARALAEATEAIRLDPADAENWILRGAAASDAAQLAPADGRDPGRLLDQARADYDAALERRPRHDYGLGGRGLVWQRKAARLHAAGQDPAECWARALADYEASERENPRLGHVRLNRASVLAATGRHEEAAWECEAARALGAAAPPVFPEVWAAALAGAKPAWLGAMRAACAARTTADGGPARAHLEAALARVPQAALADAELRGAAAESFYALARIDAVRSSGHAGPAAAPEDIPAREAAALRDTAFDRLRAALRLGLADARRLQEEPDLAPLRSDGRWAEVAGPAAGR